MFEALESFWNKNKPNNQPVVRKPTQVEKFEKLIAEIADYQESLTENRDKIERNLEKLKDSVADKKPSSDLFNTLTVKNSYILEYKHVDLVLKNYKTIVPALTRLVNRPISKDPTKEYFFDEYSQKQYPGKVYRTCLEIGQDTEIYKFVNNDAMTYKQIGYPANFPNIVIQQASGLLTLANQLESLLDKYKTVLNKEIGHVEEYPEPEIFYDYYAEISYHFYTFITIMDGSWAVPVALHIANNSYE